MKAQAILLVAAFLKGIQADKNPLSDDRPIFLNPDFSVEELEYLSNHKIDNDVVKAAIPAERIGHGFYPVPTPEEWMKALELLREANDKERERQKKKCSECSECPCKCDGHSTHSGHHTWHSTGTQTGEPTGHPTGTETDTNTGTPTAHCTDSNTGNPTGTQTDSQTGEPTGTQTDTQTGEPTGTQTDQPTGTQTDSQTGEPTGTQTGEPTGTQTDQPTGTQTDSQTGEPTDTQTGEPTGTQTDQPTATDTQIGEPTGTQTDQPTDTQTGEPTGTQTDQPTDTQTGEPTGTQTGEPTATDTQIGEPTGTQTDQPTDTQTGEPTGTQTGETTGTQTDQPTDSATMQPEVYTCTRVRPCENVCTHTHHEPHLPIPTQILTKIHYLPHYRQPKVPYVPAAAKRSHPANHNLTARHECTLSNPCNKPCHHTASVPPPCGMETKMNPDVAPTGVVPVRGNDTCGDNCPVPVAVSGGVETAAVSGVALLAVAAAGFLFL